MNKHSHYGGDWTEVKLRVIRKYLKAYLNVLKNQQWAKTIYVDAFAGPGKWTRKKDNKSKNQLDAFEVDEGVETSEGSPIIALRLTEPSFNEFIFIEQDKKKLKKLKKLVADEFEHKLESVKFVNSDANAEVARLCQEETWHRSPGDKSKGGISSRAVVFLDPFGMNVQWTTIEAIAKTKAIDLWVMVSLMGTNRHLRKDVEAMTDEEKRKLNALFGREDWLSAFYKHRNQLALDGQNTGLDKTSNPYSDIVEYYLSLLKGIFEGVSEQPLLLGKTLNNPIFVMFFAAGNKNGAKIAPNIATSITKDSQ